MQIWYKNSIIETLWHFVKKKQSFKQYVYADIKRSCTICVTPCISGWTSLDLNQGPSAYESGECAWWLNDINNSIWICFLMFMFSPLGSFPTQTCLWVFQASDIIDDAVFCLIMSFVAGQVWNLPLRPLCEVESKWHVSSTDNEVFYRCTFSVLIFYY